MSDPYTRVVRRTNNRTVLLAGLIATAVVTLAGMAGVLDRPEWWTQDMRYRHARRTPDRLGDQVRLVAIDDRALDTIGRWPWSRDLVADALREVARAGARGLAIDVLFGDVQSAATDGALAESIGEVPTVLAVNMDEGRLDSSAWSGAAGERALRAMIDAACMDLTRPAEAIADAAGLEGERRERFLERPKVFKSYAAWDRLVQQRRDGAPATDLASFVRSMTGGDSTLDRFAERGLLEEAFERDRSFGLLSRFMGTGFGPGAPLDAPPIAVLSERAAGVGFVNSKPDADDQYRRVRPFWPTPYGNLPQFGLAAGLLQLGIAPADVTVADGALRFPDGRRLPLDDGMIFVDWPTDIFDTTLRDGGRSGATGALPVGVLIDLAEQRRVLRSIEDRYAALGADLAARQADLDAAEMAAVPVSDATRAKVREQGEFVAGDLDVRGTEDVADLPPEEQALVGAYREWWRLDKELVAGRAVVAEAEARVRGELEGRMVFFGWIATGVMADMINTVYGARTPGVYFHAAVADMVISNEHVWFWPDWTGWVAALLVGSACAGIAWRTGAGASTAVTVAIVLAWAGIGGAWAFATLDTVIPVAVPVIAALASQAASVSTAAVVNQREKARITRQFRARVSPQLVDLLASDPNALSMRGEQRRSTILFGDLAGFTTISERLGSEAVVATLNLYMGAMARELTDRRAYVNKFLGDGLLAFWSAFGDEPEQGQLAIEACLACQRAVREIGERPDRQGLPPVSLRLGVATGVVTIGDCGAPPDLNDYTVIGDSANLAARLESANKQFGTPILFDGATRELIRDPRGVTIVPLGRVVVVGQSVPIEVFTMAVDEPAPGWTEAIAEAVEAFAPPDIAPCEAAWARLEAAHGPSSIAKPFREAMADSADQRDGVLRLRAK